MNPDDLRRADAIEVVIGQGAKPGGGGMLLGQKISDRVAEMRDLPKGVDQRSACRHPDWTGPDDLEIKIGELREITDWRKPIYFKIGATRTYFDVALAVKSGADVIVLDGMEGGTAASQEVFIEHVGTHPRRRRRRAGARPRRSIIRSWRLDRRDRAGAGGDRAGDVEHVVGALDGEEDLVGEADHLGREARVPGRVELLGQAQEGAAQDLRGRVGGDAEQRVRRLAEPRHHREQERAGIGLGCIAFPGDHRTSLPSTRASARSGSPAAAA